MVRTSSAQSICFGKLPIAGDFLRGDGAAPEFTELDDWIQHGMYDSQQRLGNTWQARFDALPRTKFIWSAGRGPVIAGWWQASQDAVGRRYPFLLAARLSSVSTNNFPALPFALADYLGDAERLLDTEFAGHDVVSAIETAQNLPCDIDWDRAHAQLEASQHKATAQDAWAGHEDIPELLLYDLEQVSSQYSPPQYSLRWPSRGDTADVSFWLRAMSAFGQHSARMLMWHEAGSTAEDAPGSVRAALCELSPRLFTGMTFFDHEDDEAYDMGRGVSDDKRTRSARARFAATVRADSQTSAIASLPKEVY